MKFKFLLFCFFSVVSCTTENDSVLTIRGKIDKKFDGFNVYFCPQPCPTAENVDSSVVKNGRFRFEIPADSSYIADLRISKRAQGYVERLLIAVEPGELEVSLGAPSTSRGTRKNEIIQKWKNEFQNADDMLRSVEVTYDCILGNPDYFGGFLYLMFKRVMSEEQLAVLDSLGYQKFIPDVTEKNN